MRKIVVAACLLLLCAVVSAIAQDLDPAAERELVQLTNQERAKAGLPPLKADPGLREAARAHAALLAQHNALSHQFPGEAPLRQRLAATGLRFARAGENVALDSEGAEGAHQGLMHSPPHRANILNRDYNSVGIGAVRSGGILFVAEDFAQLLPQMSVEQVESTVAKRLGSQGNAHDPRLRRVACDLGAHNEYSPRALFKLFPEAHRSFVFTLNDTTKIPEEVAAMKNAARGYALGACFVRSENSPEGMFWVALIVP